MSDKIGDKRFYSTRDAARYLGVKPETIKYHVYESGYLEPVRLTKRTLLFTREELDKLRESGVMRNRTVS